MSNQGKGSFLDSKTLIAIVMTTIVWVGWQAYLQKKYPEMNKPKTEAEQTAGAGSAEAKTAQGSDSKEPDLAKKQDEISEASPQQEQTLTIENSKWSMKVSSQGMGIRDFELKSFKDRDEKSIRIGAAEEGHLPYETALIGRNRPLHFTLEKLSETHVVGRASVDGLNIVKSLEFYDGEYRIDAIVEVSGPGENFLGLSTYMTEQLKDSGGHSFFAPQLDRQDIYVEAGDGKERHYLAPDGDQSVKVEGVQVAAFGTQYFTQALVDHSDVRPEFRGEARHQTKSIVGVLNHNVLNRSDRFIVKYSAYIGPKDLGLLKGVSEQLAGVVDFGFFSMLGRPILKMLKWFHGVVGNWGIAIILLTLLVRFLVLPFNVMSFKSMKAMQVIQPQLQALRERYKEDPTRLQQETMALFKANKVNPLGGCLPVLLQIPIFFALYQVLGHSVELYRAPFLLWIHDLSHKDPYFVLPVLMGITMFIQQKITPSAMDPAQAKILMFMPIIFSVFMLSLPSGLTLYIFVSTLFGICQQLYLIKSQPLKTVATK